MVEHAPEPGQGIVSVIVPVYNEVDTVTEVLDRLASAPFDKQVIVVDDCSIDGTRDIISERKDTILLLHERNRGKGASIRTGIKEATGEVVIIQDADLEYDPNEIPVVVKPIFDGKTDIVYGSRFMRGLPSGMPWPNKIANKILVWVVILLFGKVLTDEATCYKAFRTSLLKSMDLECERFEFCPEVTAKALRGGVDILEVELHNYVPRTSSEGKKIKYTDGFEAVFTLLRHRFNKKKFSGK